MSIIPALKEHREMLEYNDFVVGVAYAPEKRPLGNWADSKTISWEQALRKVDVEEELGLCVFTGKASGITVIDIDKAADNKTVLTMKELGIHAVQVKTGFGIHIYFGYEKKLETRSGILKGIDIRNDGACVIVPPTRHPNGRYYEWANQEKGGWGQSAEGVVRILGGGKSKHPKMSPAIITSVVYKGARNDSLFKHLCSCRSRGYGNTEIGAEAAVINEIYLVPKLSYREVGAVVKSVCRYAIGNNGRLKENKTTAKADIIGFFREVCGEGGNVEKSVLYAEYLKYSERQGLAALYRDEFFKRMKTEMGLKIIQRGTGKGRFREIQGVCIKPKVIYLRERIKDKEHLPNRGTGIDLTISGGIC